jgi:hypothetical protein
MKRLKKPHAYRASFVESDSFLMGEYSQKEGHGEMLNCQLKKN